MKILSVLSFIGIIFIVNPLSADVSSFGQLLLSPKSIDASEYDKIAYEEFGGNLNSLDKLSTYVSSVRKRLQNNVDSVGFEDLELKDSERLIALLEAATYEYSQTALGKSNDYLVTLKARIGLNESELVFESKLIDTGSPLELYVRETRSQSYFSLLRNSSGTFLNGALSLFANLDAEEFSHNINQVSLRYLLNLISNVGPEVLDELSIDEYEKAVLQLSRMSDNESFRQLGEGWRKVDLTGLRENTLLTSIKLVDQSPDHKGKAFEELFESLYPEISKLSLASSDYSALDAYKEKYLSYLGEQLGLSSEESTLQVSNSILNTVLENPTTGFPVGKFVELSNDFVANIFANNLMKWSHTYDGEKASSVEYYENLSEAKIKRPKLIFDSETQADEISFVEDLILYFYSDLNKTSGLRKNKHLRNKLLSIYFTKILSAEGSIFTATALRNFIELANQSEKDLMYSHLIWSRDYWKEDYWTENGKLHKALGRYDKKEFEYHRKQVGIQSFLLKKLMSPHAGDNTTVSVDGGSVKVGDSASYSDLIDEIGVKSELEEKLKPIYQSIFSSALDGKYILREKTTQGESGKTEKVLELEYNTDTNKLLYVGNIDSSTHFTKEPNEKISQSLREAFEYLTVPYKAEKDPLNNKFNITVKNDKELGRLHTFTSMAPGYPTDMDALSSSLNVEWFSQYGGKTLYEESVRRIICLAVAANEMRKGRQSHREAGIIFEPEVAEGKWLNDSQISQKLLEARVHYVNAGAIYRSLLDPKLFGTNESLPFGLEGKIQGDQLIASIDEKMLFVSATPLELIEVKLLDNTYQSGVLVSLDRVRNLSNSVDFAKDAYGYTGVIGMVAGVEEIFKKLELYSKVLKDSTITQQFNNIKNSLSLQKFKFSKEAKHKLVYAKALELGVIDLKIAQARIGLRRSHALSDANEANFFSAKFTTESERQFAEAAQAEAAKALLGQNVQDYKTFVSDAQLNIVMTVLPRYTLQLEEARRLLVTSKEVLNKYKLDLAQKRQKYLKGKNKRSFSSLFKAVALQLVDAVSTAYGLPPLGSIVNKTFTGIKAAAEGNLAVALQSLTDAAKLSGADKIIKQQASKLLDEKVFKSKAMSWIEKPYKKLENNGIFKRLKKVAEDSKLDDFAVAKTLSVVSSAGKGFLPDMLVDRLISPKEYEWAKDEADFKAVATSAATKHGKLLLEQLSRSGVNQSLALIGEKTKLVKFVRKQAKIEAKQGPRVSGSISAAAEGISEQFSSDVKKIIEGQKLSTERKFAILKKQTEYLLIDEMKKYDPDKVIDGDFIELTNSLKNLNFKEGESRDVWKDFLKNDLKKFVNNKDYKDKLEKAFKEAIPEDSIKKLKNDGIVKTGKIFIKNLGKSLSLSEFDIQTESIDLTSKEDLAKKLKVIEQGNKDIRDILAQVKIVSDLNVGALTAKFVPETQGRMVHVLDSWEKELTTMFKESGNQDLVEDLEGYYKSVKSRFENVDLLKELTAENIDILMNPPTVSLPNNMVKAITKLDDAILASKNAMNNISKSQISLKSQMDEIYNAKEDYEKQVDNLFKPFINLIDEVNKSLKGGADKEGAISLAGVPSEATKKWLRNSSALGLYTEKLKLKIQSEAELSTKKLERLKKQLDDSKLALYNVKKNNRTSNFKYYNIGDYKKAFDKANQVYQSELVRIEGIKSSIRKNEEDIRKLFGTAATDFVEHLADQVKVGSNPGRYQFDDLHKNALLSTFRDDLGKVPPKEQLNKVSSKISKGILSIPDGATGLYLTAKGMQVEDYQTKLHSMMAGFEQKSASHRSLAAALASSSARSLQKAAEYHFEASKLSTEIAKAAIEILQAERKVKEKELESTEYDFYVADTEYSLAKLDSWRLNQSGENLQLLSSSQIEEISNEVTRSFKDIAFISHYYENRDIKKMFNAFLTDSKNADLVSVFNRDGIWKPEAINKAISAIKVAKDMDKSRAGSQVITQNYFQTKGGDYHKLVVSKSDLTNRRLIKSNADGTASYASIFVNLEPVSASDLSSSSIYENPDPFSSRYVRDLSQEKSRENRVIRPITSRFLERNGERTRYYKAYATKPKQEGVNFADVWIPDMYIRPMGDGFVTRNVPDGATKAITSIQWETTPLKIIWDKTDQGILRSASTSENLGDEQVNLNYYAPISAPTRLVGDSSFEETRKAIIDQLGSPYSKDLSDRNSFFMLPMAGTYELLFKLPEGGVDSLDDQMAVQIWMFGSTLNAQAGQ